MRRRFLTRYAFVTVLSSVAMMLVSWFNAAILEWPRDVIIGTVAFACIIGTPILALSWSRHYERLATGTSGPQGGAMLKHSSMPAWKLAFFAAGVFCLCFGVGATVLLSETRIGLVGVAFGALATLAALRMALTSGSTTVE